MPEERGLYPQMRVLDQLVYFARLHGMRPDAARDQARSWLQRLDLEARADDRVVALSHGNKQRVQLAVALVHEPDLLVLDEPFAGLDPSAVDVLSDVLRDVARRRRAILFSSHQLDLVERLCDRIVIVDPRPSPGERHPGRASSSSGTAPQGPGRDLRGLGGEAGRLPRPAQGRRRSPLRSAARRHGERPPGP